MYETKLNHPIKSAMLVILQGIHKKNSLVLSVPQATVTETFYLLYMSIYCKRVDSKIFLAFGIFQ